VTHLRAPDGDDSQDGGAAEKGQDGSFLQGSVLYIVIGLVVAVAIIAIVLLARKGKGKKEK